MSKKIRVYGTVQGVGFRPFVYNLAIKYNLYGYVNNDSLGVNIEVSGKTNDISIFLKELKNNPPPLAVIEDIKVENSNKQFFEFKIENSNSFDNKTTTIPSDIAICKDCIDDIFDKNNFRYNYSLTNCTNCGPRYSIIKTIPYDRKNTSLKDFPLCKKCQNEFENPTNRRYHAQAISCEECGPTTFLYDSKQTLIASKIDAINLASSYINDGKILAIKSMGGFHIVCDATNDKSIIKLREFKKRAIKPFAIMFKDINNLKNYAVYSNLEENILTSKERPIVLLEKKYNQNLSNFVAPNIKKIGCFLPNSALHYLLFINLPNPIIATSANLKGESIITTKEDIFLKLNNLVDFVLDYNREILNSCDDSIIQVVNEKIIKLRNSRGYAPSSLKIDTKFNKKILSLGANQKSTFSIAFDNKIITSLYLGDLDSISSIENYKKTVENFLSFYDFIPEIIVCDKHPKYESTKFAFELKDRNPNLKLVQIQHHYAHVLAVLAEKSINEDVLAFVFDGTGYGDDKNIWGGEVFIANKKDYKRAYHLKYFKLLGGEFAIKEPKRVALSLLFDNFTLEEILNLPLDFLNSFEKSEIKTLYTLWQKNLNSPLSSSFGRLFDAVCSLANILHIQEYEGQTGLYIENLYDKNIKELYSYEIINNSIDFSKMIKEILKEKDKKIVASKFINTVANIVLDISNRHKEMPIILCGGVFQNKTLVEILLKEFHKMNRKIYLGEKYSPNDESISLGQVYFQLQN
ncbi:carbamoyltransferase HypF [Aliarcobacter cibarius]|uniref:Carbamoyltransferase n=1 Tax=Aliarcobacter cibarius TaxID=255507 RepID=A0A7L5JQ12_9BACT|nr:carbamoyltransferase HypF [Aliarcobacter cibarius]QKJ27166.1 [Ni-Fe] hydrogenase maturation protein HypF [Aliarcobacter cibarius]TLT01612.1 carbamoyltransferase HypF [Aliarcobacter cibarius]TLT02103.1 carbamoyltransferase HypF [Aliarcobacter cibarius]